jgi:hypothetical protein
MMRVTLEKTPKWMVFGKFTWVLYGAMLNTGDMGGIHTDQSEEEKAPPHAIGPITARILLSHQEKCRNKVSE